MSLRSRLIQIRADGEKWEDRLFIAAVVLFIAAVLTNAAPLFGNGEITVPGALCTWLYLIAWFSAAIMLRDRAGWVRTALIVRWTAVAAVLLGIAVSAAGSANMLVSLCVMPYAVFISAYGGLPRVFWVYYLLMLVQAVTATLFSRRLRRREKARQDEEDYGLDLLDFLDL